MITIDISAGKIYIEDDCGSKREMKCTPSVMGNELARNDSNVSISRTNTQNSSWQEIANAIHKGLGKEIFSIGDTVNFKLNNGKTASVAVTAFDVGGKNNVVFSFVNLHWESQMNVKNTNTGGWYSAAIRPWLNNTVLSDLPSDLVSVIQEREIIQKIGDKTYKSSDKLWLPSKTEMFGSDKRYEDVDFGDTQFPLFNTEKSRVKFVDKSGETSWYWLRSPNVSYSTYFWIVGNSGSAYGSGASNSCGVCPCFII